MWIVKGSPILSGELKTNVWSRLWSLPTASSVLFLWHIQVLPPFWSLFPEHAPHDHCPLWTKCFRHSLIRVLQSVATTSSCPCNLESHRPGSHMALLLPTELEINPSLPQPFTPMAAMPGVTDIGKSWQLRRGRVQVMHGRYDSPDWTRRNERER